MVWRDSRTVQYLRTGELMADFKGVWFKEWETLHKKGFSIKQLKQVHALMDKKHMFGYENISYSAKNQLELLNKEVMAHGKGSN